MKHNRSPRDIMETRLEDMVKLSTDCKVDGKVYIVYERVGDLQWLPGKGDGEFLRWSKHWRLVIQLGFDCFSLEFLENSLVSHQGVLLVEPCDLKSINRDETTLYPVGDLRALSTDVLFNWILIQFNKWTEYNLLQKNCQHFVHYCLAYFETEGHLVNRTNHLRSAQPESIQGDRVEKAVSSSSTLNWEPMRSKFGQVARDFGRKSKSVFQSLSTR